MPRMDFFYEFASTYSYIATMRVAPLAEAAGVILRWRPFLLGPIFKAQGWDTSPFNLYPAKGRYMLRDCERQAAALGLTFRLPEPFPQNTLLAARVAVVGLEDGWGEEFSRRVYRAQFAEGRQIGEAQVIGQRARAERPGSAGTRGRRRHQGKAARQHRGGAAAQHFRRTELHRERRTVLGQRPAGAGAGFCRPRQRLNLYEPCRNTP
jgi:2-hydroxychromene-2-carboxylate isomerase